MKFHREGRRIMIGWFLILVVLNIPLYIFFPEVYWLLISAGVISLILFGLVAQFFRVPNKNIASGKNNIVSPCDGKVVVIEEVHEPEFVDEKRIQVSIFMSPLNVHVNYAPISGEVEYYKYHEGLYLVAWHPKSSTENERTTVVVKHENGKSVLFRQIAGAVARRIICYKDKGDRTEQGREFGFIKFGSRIDLLLPLDTQLDIKIGDKVKGAETVIGRFE